MIYSPFGPFKPFSPLNNGLIGYGRGGPMCWKTEQGCSTAQKVAIGILPVVLIILIIGLAFTDKRSSLV